MKLNKYITYLIIGLLFYSCATSKPQYRAETYVPTALPSKPIAHTFYLVGDAGKTYDGKVAEGLKVFKTHVKNKNTENDVVIYLGDNIYPSGLPDKGDENRKKAELSLDYQIDAVEGFKGRTIFIPGNHDWYTNGVKGLKNQEKYIEDALGKNTFLPEDGCPLETVEIGDAIEIIIVDSQWYLENWNKHPTINDECEIKTRDRFFMEVESALKKAQNKHIIFAIHHPMYTNGSHGGFFSASKHLYPFQHKTPIPVLASLITQIRSQGGVSIQDRYNERYNELMSRLETLLVDYSDNLIVVSGHEHSLQYIEDEFVTQIVSGSASKRSDASLNNNGLFSYGKQGFAEYIVYEDGSSWVQFFGYENEQPILLYQKEVFPPKEKYDFSHLEDSFPTSVKTSVYTDEETERTGFFKTLWGDHYRKLYSKDIDAEVATLDTLYGGLEIVRKGGGHQTRSLRLKTKDGKELNMRALRKSATQYLQTVVFKDKYIEDDFERTQVEGLILDFYTSAHPYAFLAVPKLSEAIDVLHTNPKLYYIPKHKHLGEYNKEYGDELYMIEERPEDSYEGSTFNYPDDIESTHDIIEKIRKDEKYKIDERAFIRARLFDMLLGDWDRHQDQWRWAQFDQLNGDKLYKPIPRDRDQVFSNFDGGLLDFMRLISSPSNQLQVYDDDVDEDDIEWMNNAGIKLDRILIQQATAKDWIAEAKFIQENITEQIVQEAFDELPEEVQDETLKEIIGHFKNRKQNLDKIAERYYNFISKLVILTGTDKDDFIDIIRKPNKETQVIITRNKDGKRADVLVDKTFNQELTKELWIYGLDDDDQFNVSGKAKRPIRIRLIGGQNNDSYTIKNGKRIKIYDHKTKPNTIVEKNGADVKLTNFYNFNTFDYKKYNSTSGIFTPVLGFNPDDGILTGIGVTKTNYGFERNPFTARHNFKFGYYFATQGFDLRYKGEYNVVQQWNLHVEGLYTSNNFAQNFFGFGNETINNDDDLDFDYNRVRTSIYRLKVGILKKAPFGSDFGLRAVFEGIKIDDTDNRFITDLVPATNTDFYDRRFFTGLEGVFTYQSYDSKINPTRGMYFHTELGAKTEIDNTEQTFGYINSHLGFYNSISTNRKLVLKTDLRNQLRFGNDIVFYQSANIGGQTGLRGFRLQRFTGQNSFVGNADLRYTFNTLKTKTLPLQFGVFGGYDIGRVWVTSEDSNTWHQSYGGGFWVSSAESISGTFNLFNSVDGLRFSFGFSFNL